MADTHIENKLEEFMEGINCIKDISVGLDVQFNKPKSNIVDVNLENVLSDTKSPSAITDIISDETSDNSGVIENEKTPHSIKRMVNAKRTKQQDDIQTGKCQERLTPLPVLKFADSNAVWLNMIYKEEATLKMRSPKIFSDRSAYLPRMRAILLDWLMEVCEVYHLRRTTYHLTVDYIDRYLTIRSSVPKTQLQLLGVSCLYIAAKLEEIYPPKLSEFSYVCDGACTESEILACELLLLNTLTWDVNPMTPTSWLSLYMQILQNLDNNKKLLDNDGIDDFQFPQYSAYQFVMASQLIDLFSMDPGYLRYSYSVIAAGAFYYIYGKEATIKVSGLSWPQFEDCVEYMAVFHKVLKNSNDPRLKTTFPIQDLEDNSNTSSLRFLKKRVPGLVSDELHCLQTHVVDLDYFEKSTIQRVEDLGFRIEKVYMKKVKKNGTKDEKDNTEKDEEEQVEETTVVVYEIEKINGCVDKDEGEDEETDDENVLNLLKVTKKAGASFDAILGSLHNDCYNSER
nr:G1/S-specific cyclin-E1 [Onthophagus taurus]